MTFRNVSDFALAFLLLEEILYYSVILLQTVYSKWKSTAILSGQNLFLSYTGENWHSIETRNVWFLLDFFLQLHSINLKINGKRVSFSACCTIQSFTYKFSHEVLRLWWFGWFFMWRTGRIFFFSCLSSRKALFWILFLVNKMLL